MKPETETVALGEGSPPARAATRGRAWRLPVAAASVLCVYLLLAAGISAAKMPWHDEGQFADPALNLATSGFMGTPVLDGSVQWLAGIGRHTYWIMPLYPAALAGWFKVFGFDLLTMRLFSVAWGFLALLLWYYVVGKLTASRRIACLALTLIGLDYVFIMNASTGRMDVMCAALGVAAFAAYLRLRERQLTLAVLVSQSLVVAGGLTHPNGVFAFGGLLFLTLYFDRRRLGWREVAAALAPYAVGGAAWGWYIRQDSAAFVAQIKGNSGGFSALTGGADRWAGLKAPWRGFQLEITRRYLGAFGLAAHSAGPARLKILVLLAYAAGVACVLFAPGLRRAAGRRPLLLLTAIYFVMMSLLEGHKSDIYLVHMIPLLASLLALSIDWCWSRRAVPRGALAASLAGLLLLQSVGLAYLIRQNHYGSRYRPVIEFLRRDSRASGLMMGSAELGFELGFDRLADDPWLGYHSHKAPDVVVVNRRYEELFAAFRDRQPEVYAHVQGLLARDFQTIYEHPPDWKVYARREGAAGR